MAGCRKAFSEAQSCTSRDSCIGISEKFEETEIEAFKVDRPFRFKSKQKERVIGTTSAAQELKKKLAFNDPKQILDMYKTLGLFSDEIDERSERRAKKRKKWREKRKRSLSVSSPGVMVLALSACASVAVCEPSSPIQEAEESGVGDFLRELSLNETSSPSPSQVDTQEKPNEWSIDPRRIGQEIGAFEIPLYCKPVVRNSLTGRRLLNFWEDLVSGIPWVGPAIAGQVFPGDEQSTDVVGMLERLESLAKIVESSNRREEIRDAAISKLTEAQEATNDKLETAFGELSESLETLQKNDRNLQMAVLEGVEYIERVEASSRKRAERLLSYIEEERRQTNGQIDKLRSQLDTLSLKVERLAMASDFDKSLERNRDYVGGFKNHYGHSVESAMFASYQSGFEGSNPRLSTSRNFLMASEHAPFYPSESFSSTNSAYNQDAMTPVYVCNVTVKQFPSIIHRLHGDPSEDLLMPLYDCRETIWIREGSPVTDVPTSRIGLLPDIWAELNSPNPSGACVSDGLECEPDKELWHWKVGRVVCCGSNVCGPSAVHGPDGNRYHVWICRPQIVPANFAGFFLTEYEEKYGGSSEECAEGFGSSVFGSHAGELRVKTSCVVPFFDPGRVAGGRTPIPDAIISQYTRSLFLSGGGRNNLGDAIYGPMVNITLSEYYPPLGEPYLVVSEPLSLMASSASIIRFLEGSVALRGWIPSKVIVSQGSIKLSMLSSSGVTVDSDRLLSHQVLQDRERWQGMADERFKRLDLSINESVGRIRQGELTRLQIESLGLDIDLNQTGPIEWESGNSVSGVPLLLAALVASREEAGEKMKDYLADLAAFKAEVEARESEPVDDSCGFLDFPCYRKVLEEFLAAIFFFAAMALIAYLLWKLGFICLRRWSNRRTYQNNRKKQNAFPGEIALTEIK
jgi:hypothetical protein